MLAHAAPLLRLCFAAAAFILTAMAMTLFVFRDSRPRRDDWRTIIRTDHPDSLSRKTPDPDR